MRFLFSVFLSFFVLFFAGNNIVVAEEFSVDLDAGEQIFSQRCVSCHAGGNNLVNPIKTLSIKDLNTYGKDSVKAIITQVTYGAQGMPVFREILDEEDIVNVANYVLNQAQNSSW
uniref:Cytochrome c-553 n=1 Tax=Vertebrata thuyoides TaxID=2006970 RepID=A0A1Z1MAS6_9FLOR|nr:cytochrome c553 [Vertebrata thuyoides]ARW63023.1 cytochrome c553 [Vertebrata thuyoides]